MVRQGEIYWLNLPKPKGSEPGYRRPCVVVQNNTFNNSKIKTVVIAILTSNLKLARAPGNVLIEKGNTGLTRDSVVNISQLLTVNKADLNSDSKIGSVTKRNIDNIVKGIELLVKRV